MNSHRQQQNTRPKKPFLVTICLTLLAVTSALGQDLDMDCRPIPPPVQCNGIRSQITEIDARYESDINVLTEQLQSAAPTQKAAINLAIRQMKAQWANDPTLRRLKIDLANCIRQFDTVPRRTVAPNILNTFFDGSVETSTSHPMAKGPYFKDITMGLQFSPNRCFLTITSFPPITLVANTPIGPVNVTVSKVAGGSGNFFPLSGQVFMPLDFLLQYATPYAKDDNAAIAFTTATNVSPRGTFNLTGARFVSTNNAPVDQCGLKVGGTQINCTLTIVGTTVFQDGFLSGYEGAFTVRGTIGVLPPPPPPPPQTRSQCLSDCEIFFDSCMGTDDKGAPTSAQCFTWRTQCRNRCPRQ